MNDYDYSVTNFLKIKIKNILKVNFSIIFFLNALYF